MGIGNKDEPITKKIKLDLSGLTREQKKIAKQDAGRLIVEGINDFLDRSKSPVSGGSFKRRTKDGGRSILFEEGDLRESIVSKNRRGDEIEVGVFKSSQTAKVFNHNSGDTVPKRNFIPSEDESFKKEIINRVNRRIDEIRNNQISSTIEPLRTSAIAAIAETFVVDDSGFTFPTIGEILRVLDDEN